MIDLPRSNCILIWTGTRVCLGPLFSKSELFLLHKRTLASKVFSINEWNCIYIYLLPYFETNSGFLWHACWPVARYSLWPRQGTKLPALSELSSQCSWRIVSTCYYSKVNTNQVNEVKIAFVGSENEVVFRWKENC